MTRSIDAQLAGVEFRPVNLDSLTRAVARAQGTSAALRIGYVNPHIISLGRTNTAVREHLAACDVVLIDGTGVWLALRLWRWGIRRMPAYRASDELVYSGALGGRTVVIGIEPDDVVHAASHLQEHGPALDVTDSTHGYATDREVVALLDAAEPRNVLIGAGSPRSEEVASLVHSHCPDALVFTVGAGTLKVYAGVRTHAPKLLSTLGLDWAYRFWREPHTRVRYMRGIPDFLRQVVAGPNYVRDVSVGAQR